jgi:hypothetical protein
MKRLKTLTEESKMLDEIKQALTDMKQSIK